jgi:hypothetical protein
MTIRKLENDVATGRHSFQQLVAYARHRISLLALGAWSRVVSVALDFDRDQLPDAFAAAGFDARRRTPSNASRFFSNTVWTDFSMTGARHLAAAALSRAVLASLGKTTRPPPSSISPASRAKPCALQRIARKNSGCSVGFAVGGALFGHVNSRDWTLREFLCPLSARRMTDGSHFCYHHCSRD